jgi:hypothetical protein
MRRFYRVTKIAARFRQKKYQYQLRRICVSGLATFTVILLLFAGFQIFVVLSRPIFKK